MRRLAATLAFAACLLAAPAAGAQAGASLAVVATTPVSIALRWEPVAGAAGYLVERSDGAPVRVDEPSYVDRTLPCATARTFSVTALDAGGGPLATVGRATGRSGPCPPPVPASPHDVFVFYYPWYGTPESDGGWPGWRILPSYDPAADDIASGYWPLGGLYSVADPGVLDRQLALVRQAGGTVLVVSWDGPGSAEDRRAPALLAAAERAGLRVAWLLEPYAGRSAATLVDDVGYLERTYGASPAFYRTTRPGLFAPARAGGQGLYFLYAPELQRWPRYCGSCDTRVAPTYWRPALDAVHAGPGGIVLGSGPFGAEELESAHMDGGFLYADLPAGGKDVAADMRRFELSLPPRAWTIPSATPGFTNDCAHASTDIVVPRRGGRTFRAQWRAMTAGPPLYGVAITSWNEWHEGTQIEPADDGHAATGTAEACRHTASRYGSYGRLGSYGYVYLANALAQRFARSPMPEAYATRRAVGERLGASTSDDGVYLVEPSDGRTRAGRRAGRTARASLPNGHAVRYTYFSVENRFAWHLPMRSRLRVTLTVLDDRPGELRLAYDAHGDAYRLAPRTVRLHGSGHWRRVSFALPRPWFGGRENGAADFRLLSPGGHATWLAGVSVHRG